MITGMANIHSKTSVGQKSIVKFINDWGKKSLNETENSISLSKVLDSETWVVALLADKNDYSKSVLAKYYKDFNSQPITTFIASNNSWTNSTYWLKVLNALIDDSDFKIACKEKLIEITGHVVEGVATGAIVSGNPNQDLQDKLLSWVHFDSVSSKVSDAMVQFANRQQAINKYKFTNLHHYLEQVKGYENAFLNYVLNPLINDADVQKIVIDTPSVYEPLIHDNISLASDLKEALNKLYETTKNDGLKSLIEKLGIIESEEGNDSIEA